MLIIMSIYLKQSNFQSYVFFEYVGMKAWN